MWHTVNTSECIECEFENWEIFSFYVVAILLHFCNRFSNEIVIKYNLIHNLTINDLIWFYIWIDTGKHIQTHFIYIHLLIHSNCFKLLTVLLHICPVFFLYNMHTIYSWYLTLNSFVVLKQKKINNISLFIYILL